MLRMKWFKETYLNNLDTNKTVKVLDIGSQCVSDQKDIYKIYFNKSPFQYIGLDMSEGFNVDIAVKKAYKWDEVSDNFCDLIITGQTFEHIEFPWVTIREMTRVLKPGGFMCIIVPSIQLFHRYPLNCQNYFNDGMIALAKYAGLEILHASTNLAPKGAGFEWYHMAYQDTMLVARKPVDWINKDFDFENYVCEIADLNQLATGLISLRQQEWYHDWKIKNDRSLKIIRNFPWSYALLKKIKKTLFN